MPSLTSSSGSILGGFESIISGLIESVLAVFQHVWQIVQGILHTVLSFASGILSTVTGIFSTFLTFALGEWKFPSASFAHTFRQQISSQSL